MEGIFPFQRIGATVSIATTASSATSTAITISNNNVCEIVNLDGTNAAAFVFTDSGATAAVSATTSMRTIPAYGIMIEHLPQGASYVSAIAIAGSPALKFTPGLG